MKRASAIKVEKKKKSNSNFFFSSEIGNFNIGGPVNQLIKKGLKVTVNLRSKNAISNFKIKLHAPN
jgi:hypothetical protein